MGPIFYLTHLGLPMLVCLHGCLPAGWGYGSDLPAIARGSGELERLELACPALAHLDAMFCRRLGDNALAAAVAGAPALCALDLSVCSALTPASVAGLAPAVALTSLDLSYSDVVVCTILCWEASWPCPFPCVHHASCNTASMCAL